MGIKQADGDGRELLFFKGAVGQDAVDELEVEGEAAAHDLGGADDVVHHDGGVLGHRVGVVRGRVVQVDVAGDAVGRHRRVMRHAAAAAHAGGGGWATRAEFF